MKISCKIREIRIRNRSARNDTLSKREKYASNLDQHVVKMLFLDPKKGRLTNRKCVLSCRVQTDRRPTTDIMKIGSPEYKRLRRNKTPWEGFFELTLQN